MSNRFRILVVDDNRDLAATIRLILTDNGYDAFQACDGAEALEVAGKKNLDLILLDYKLPDIDGLELQEKLAGVTDAEFIIITAHASVESAAEAVHRKRIVGYETKPLDMERLKAFIEQVRTRRQVEKDLALAVCQTRERARENAALLECARAVLTHRDFEHAARQIFDLCAKLIGATAGYVAMLTEDDMENEILFLESGGRDCEVNPNLPMPVRGLRAEAYRTGAVVYENDFSGSKWMDFMPEGHVKLDNVLFAPLRQRDKIVGVMGLANKPEPFTRKDASMAEGFGEFASISLHNAVMLESLEKARKTAESATRTKSEFLAHMSHEIRTPMNAVVGLAHILKDTPLKPDQREYVDIIMASSDILLSVINDILDFSKIESGRIDLETVDFNLGKVLRDVTEVASIRAEQKGIALRCEIDAAVCQDLSGDMGRLRQVLLNLANNAVKFTEEGEVRIAVAAVRDAETEVALRFSVEDTGVGIPQDRARALFEPFIQADASVTRKYGGTGLGLAISKKIAEMMGGEIGVWSEEGVGSNFWFTAVLKKQAVCKWREPTARDADVVRGVNMDRPIRILVAEDNLFNQKLIKIVLTKLGLDSDIAANGLEAVHMLENGRYDLVLMDIQMPEMGGVEAARQIRGADAAYKDIPIIALTADAIVEDREAWFRAGMNGCVIKPIKPENLWKAIIQQIGAR